MFQLCITAIIVTGCTAVYSPAPVGSEPAVLDVDEWNGTWIHSGGYLTMTVIGPEEARVRVGWVEGEKVETYEGLIRTAGDWMFGNVHNGPEKTTWLWGRILKESGKIILWVPSVEVFATMVKSGQLPGTIDDDGNVVLSELSPEHLRSIMSCTAGPAMDWEHPIALLRDPDPEILPRGLYKVYEIDDVNAGTQKLPPHPRIVSYDQAAVSGESGLPVRCLVVNA